MARLLRGKLGGQTMIKKYLRVGDLIWIHFDGRTFTESTRSKSSYGKKSSSENLATGIIESPMPGKILKVNVKIGDQVVAKQTVCIIEAMKMEYSLKAPFDGRVKAVGKAAGQQVLLGEKILELEKL